MIRVYHGLRLIPDYTAPRLVFFSYPPRLGNRAIARANEDASAHPSGRWGIAEREIRERCREMFYRAPGVSEAPAAGESVAGATRISARSSVPDCTFHRPGIIWSLVAPSGTG